MKCSSLPKLIADAMGQDAIECIYEHVSHNSAFMIMALCPVASSNVHDEHNNPTSDAIKKQIGDFAFCWNDVFPYSPTAENNVNQKLLQRYIQSNSVPDLVSAYWKRTLLFIDKEQKRNDKLPLIVVTGITANMAFNLIKSSNEFEPFAYSYQVFHMTVEFYANFAIIVNMHHPSAHMKRNCNPTVRKRFKLEWKIVDAMRKSVHRDILSLLESVDKETKIKLESYINAMKKLGIPTTDEYRHLAGIDWSACLEYFENFGEEAFKLVLQIIKPIRIESYAGQQQLFNTVVKLSHIGWTKDEIIGVLMSKKAGSSHCQLQLIETIEVYRDMYHLEKKDIISLVRAGGSKVQTYLRGKYGELVQYGYSSKDILSILNRNVIGRNQLTLQIATVLSNVAILLANDINNGSSRTLDQLASLINTGHRDIYLFVQYCIGSKSNTSVTIHKSVTGKDILLYLEANDIERRTLVNTVTSQVSGEKRKYSEP